MDIHSSIRCLPGVGNVTEKNLLKLGISSVEDLLLFMPRRYRDFSKTKRLADIKIEEQTLVKMRVLSTPCTSAIKKGLTRSSFQAG